MQRLVRSLTLFGLLAVLAPEASHAADLRMEMEISESINSQTNYLDRGDLELAAEFNFDRDTAYNLLNIYPTLHISLAEGVEGYLQAGVHLEHHFDEVENDEADAEISGAYLSLYNRRMHADIGIQPVQFGNGRILSDDAPAANLKVEAGDFSVQFTAARVMDQSPAVGLTLGYSPGFLEQVSLFGVWFQDEDDTFAQSLPLISQLLLDIESEADLYWIGATADLFIGNALFSMLGAYQTGKISYFNRENRFNFDVSSFYGEMSLDANWSPALTTGVFCVVASGDELPAQEEINAFISIQSYNPRAAIFFDPEFFGILDSERLTYGSGPYGGVIAPGLNVSVAPAEDLRIDGTATAFYAHEALDDGSDYYGWELDLAVEIIVKPYFTIYAQAARFWHGDYFEAAMGEDISPATRLAMGVYASF